MDQQQRTKFWRDIIALGAIVTAWLVFPPAGYVLSAAYGSFEVASGAVGMDLHTKEKLGTKDRWIYVASGGLGIAAFPTGARLSSSSYKAITNVGTTASTAKMTKISDAVNVAYKEGSGRLRQSKIYAIERSRQAILKTEGPVMKATKVVDEKVTNFKNNLNISSTREEFALAGFGEVKNVASNTHKVENAAKGMYSKIKGSGGDVVKQAGKPDLKNERQYFDHINEIGKRTDLTSEQKLAKIQEAYSELEVKGDVTVVSDMKFLKPKSFVEGRVNIDWPEKMGFLESSIQAINKENLLPKRWDRVGGRFGENFTTLPDNGIPFTYNQRAIPYIENQTARHVGTFENKSYFDSIDAIKSDNLNELNKIVMANGKSPISNVDFMDFKAHYMDFQKSIKEVIGNADATYGVKGTAAPWQNSSTGKVLMDGGAEQIVTPLNADMLEMLGVIPKY